MAQWRDLTFAESTKTVYRTHRATYLGFCRAVNCEPVPATVENNRRYAAFLGRSRAFSTVAQYLNIIRLIHVELGLMNPLDNWPLTSLLRGMKRGKGSDQQHKLPLSFSDLQKLSTEFNMGVTRDCQCWAAILCCFFGLLRISNVTVPSPYTWDSHRIIMRRCKRNISPREH